MISRHEALERLSTGGPFDVLVVGGGITGAGIALDAASRGARVALIEMNDFASGTSSKSSKLIHGGLRYLATRDISLMREAATERDLLRRLAPHLVKPVPFILPRWAGAGVKADAGLWMYDLLSTFRNFKRHSWVDEEEVSKFVPASRKLTSGLLYWDAQTDDVRLVLAVLKAAEKHGAVASNYVQAIQVNGNRVVAVDVLSDTKLSMDASAVVNATGVWADEVMNLEDSSTRPMLRPSKGVHLVLRAESLPLNGGCLFPGTDGRMLFAVPWRSSVIVGTTDVDYDDSLDAPTVSQDERNYLLQSLTTNFRREFGDSQVCSSYAGLRPLLDAEPNARTADLSRKHKIVEGSTGVITITGGKLTTYRLMAKQAVDKVTKRAGIATKSITHKVPLSEVGSMETILETASKLGLDMRTCEHLVHSYGDDALAVMDIARKNGLVEKVAEDLPYIAAEFEFATRFEMAMGAGDLLERRTRLALEAPRSSVSKHLERLKRTLA